jgi:hypothetical protein
MGMVDRCRGSQLLGLESAVSLRTERQTCISVCEKPPFKFIVCRFVVHSKVGRIIRVPGIAVNSASMSVKHCPVGKIPSSERAIAALNRLYGRLFEAVRC